MMTPAPGADVNAIAGKYPLETDHPTGCATPFR
jgi:hypothetical protein